MLHTLWQWGMSWRQGGSKLLTYFRTLHFQTSPFFLVFLPFSLRATSQPLRRQISLRPPPESPGELARGLSSLQPFCRLQNLMHCWIISPYFSRFSSLSNSHLPPSKAPIPCHLPHFAILKMLMQILRHLWAVSSRHCPPNQCKETQTTKQNRKLSPVKSCLFTYPDIF